MHRHHAANLERADALLFGRLTYEMMEAAWRQTATGEWPDWIDEYEFVVQPIVAGHGPTSFAGLTERLDLELWTVKGAPAAVVGGQQSSTLR